MYFRSAQKRLSGVFSTPFFFSNAASTQPEAGAHTCKAGLGKPPTLGARLSARLRAVASFPRAKARPPSRMCSCLRRTILPPPLILTVCKNPVRFCSD